MQHNKSVGDETVEELAKALCVVYKNPHFGKPLIKVTMAALFVESIALHRPCATFIAFMRRHNISSPMPRHCCTHALHCSSIALLIHCTAQSLQLMVGDMDVEEVATMMEKHKFHVRAGGAAIEYTPFEVEVFRAFAAELPPTIVSHQSRFSLLTEGDRSRARQRRTLDGLRSTPLTREEEQDVRDAHSLPGEVSLEDPSSNPCVLVYWQDLEMKTTDKLGEAPGLARTVEPEWKPDESGMAPMTIQRELLTDEDKKGENRVLVFDVWHREWNERLNGWAGGGPTAGEGGARKGKEFLGQAEMELEFAIKGVQRNGEMKTTTVPLRKMRGKHKRYNTLVRAPSVAAPVYKPPEGEEGDEDLLLGGGETSSTTGSGGGDAKQAKAGKGKLSTLLGEEEGGEEEEDATITIGLRIVGEHDAPQLVIRILKCSKLGNVEKLRNKLLYAGAEVSCMHPVRAARDSFGHVPIQAHASPSAPGDDDKEPADLTGDALAAIVTGIPAAGSMMLKGQVVLMHDDDMRYDVKLEEAGLLDYARSRTLQELVLAMNPKIGHPGCIALGNALVHCSSLLLLDLGGCKIGTAGLLEFLPAVHNNNSDFKPDMPKPKKKEEGKDAKEEEKVPETAEMAAARRKYARPASAKKRHVLSLCQLRTLILWGNKIEPLGAEKLAEALTHNNTLTKLNLGWNNIGRGIIPNLAAGRTKDLEMRLAREHGVKACAALANALAMGKNKVLSHLDLTCNALGADGAQAFAKAIPDFMTLETLVMTDNGPDAQSLLALGDALKKGTANGAKLTEIKLVSAHTAVPIPAPAASPIDTCVSVFLPLFTSLSPLLVALCGAG
jgi:hypothetical protein